MMKRLLLILSLALLVMSVQAAPPLSGGAYTLMQKGFPAELTYSAGLTIPTFTPDSAGYRLLTLGDVLYADRGVGEAGELVAGRVMEMLLLKPFSFPLEVVLGGGSYQFINTDGEDVSSWAWRAGLSTHLKPLFVFVGGDVVRVEGPDIYVVGIQIALAP